MRIIKSILGAFSKNLILQLSIVFVLLIPTAAQALPILFDDGGTHDVNYIVNDGMIVSNSSTVNVQTGASISGLVPFQDPSNLAVTINSQEVSGGGNLNMQGGQVNGNIASSNFDMSGGLVTGGVFDHIGNVNISGGVVLGRVTMFGGTHSISDGVIQGGLHMEALGSLDISGGTIFDQIIILSGIANISSGTFIGGDTDPLLRSQDSSPVNVSGGNFSSDIGFESIFEGYFNFFGNGLVLSTPSLIGGTSSIPIYETQVSGTLLDGNYISQRIECVDFSRLGNAPCSGVQIHNVPEPVAIWLFGIGMIGLGFARRKQQPGTPDSN